MPCFNDGAYIEEAIESVNKQTYEDIEIIVIDDGSDDPGTVETIQKLSSENIRILRTNHVGPAAARNYGISKASGKYILPLDADDTIESDYIEKACSIIANDEKIGAVYCEADLFGERSGRWDLPNYSEDILLLDNIVFITALFRKRDWEIIGGYNENMAMGMEDYDFWISMLELGKKIVQIHEILFHYRIKKISRTTNLESNCQVMQQTYELIYDNHREYYQRNAEKYAKILRNALIEQVLIRKKYERIFGKVIKYKDYPVIGRVVKKIVET